MNEAAHITEAERWSGSVRRGGLGFFAARGTEGRDVAARRHREELNLGNRPTIRFYNIERLQSTLEYVTPIEFEDMKFVEMSKKMQRRQ